MERDAELDSLLDEALNDFGAAGTGAAAAKAGSTASARSAAPPPALPFDPMGGGRPPPAKKASKASAAKPAAASAPPDDTDAVTQELAEQLRSLMAHMGGGAPGGRAGSGGDAPEEDILATIAALERQTRFSTGGSEDASAAGPSGAFPPQMDEAAYQAMLAQFEQMGADPAVASLLDTMMAQLLSKDVLYEPLQQISARYPSWLAHKRGAIPAEDHARYTRQSALVAQLLAVFDMAPEDRGRVMELMQEMQACGAPPQEIMAELAPGLTFGADGAPQFPPGGTGGVPPELANSCAQQ